jgi:pyridoxine kinase
VAECIRQTPEGADERLGVWLENALPKLRQE